MDPLKLLTEELEKKRKAIIPLREAIQKKAGFENNGETSAEGDTMKKRKIYLTNAQARKLQAELTAREGSADSSQRDFRSNKTQPGKENQELATVKYVSEPKKSIPNAEVYKRLR